MNYTDQQIKKMMAARKRELARVSRSFPKWRPGMSTADYLMLFDGANGRAAQMLPYDLTQYGRPAAYIVGPEVIEEVEA